jgi:signal peptidase I
VFVSRVIGRPNEKISVKQDRILINGVPLAVSGEGELKTEVAGREKYGTQGSPACQGGEFTNIAVPAGSFFVVGDNRCTSRDSRHWGSLQFSFIVGKVVTVE